MSLFRFVQFRKAGTGILLGYFRQGVSHGPLDKRQQVLMRREHLREKTIPAWALRLRLVLDGRQFGEQIFAEMWPEFASAKRQRPVGCIQCPRVSIEVSWQDRDAQFRLRECEHGP